MGFQFQSVASVSSFLIDGLNIGYAEIGMLIGLYMLPGVVISLPSGLLSKHLGDKLTISYGLLLMGFGGILIGLSQSYKLIFTGRLLSGIGAVLMNVVVTKAVADWFAGREIRTAFALMLASWPFGIALGLMCQNAVAIKYSWQLVMFLTSALCVAGFVLTAVLYRSPPSELSPNASGKTFSIPIRELIPVSMAGIAWAIFNIGFTIYFSFAPDLLATRGMSSTDAGTTISIGIWITMFSVPLGGYLTERINRPNTSIVVFSLLSAVTMALFPYLSFPIVLSILMGLWIGPPPGPMVALPTLVLSPENRGPGIGIFYTWFYIGMVIGPVLGGIVKDATDSAAAPILLGAALFTTVVFFLALYWRFQAKYADRPGC